MELALVMELALALGMELVLVQDEFTDEDIQELYSIAPGTAILTGMGDSDNETASEPERVEDLLEELPEPLTAMYDPTLGQQNPVGIAERCEDAYLNMKRNIHPDQCERLEVKTKQQAKSQDWHNCRESRITSTTFHSVCTGNGDHLSETTLKKIMHYDDTTIPVPAFVWGREQEEMARECYAKKVNKIHKNAKVSFCGFAIRPDEPHLGASPDAKVVCDCCGEGVVEIKSPCKYREGLPDVTVTDDFCLDQNYELKKTHPYYYQVQLHIDQLRKRNERALEESPHRSLKGSVQDEASRGGDVEDDAKPQLKVHALCLDKLPFDHEQISNLCSSGGLGVVLSARSVDAGVTVVTAELGASQCGTEVQRHAVWEPPRLETNLDGGGGVAERVVSEGCLLDVGVLPVVAAGSPVHRDCPVPPNETAPGLSNFQTLPSEQQDNCRVRSGSGQRRTTDQIKFQWKNLKARATKDHAEAINPQTGNKLFKRGDYTDVVLDIIGGSQRKGLKRLSSNKDDDYKALLQKETERAEVQICLAEEQLTLTKIQQTKARLEIRLLKAKLRQAGLSTSDEEL
ncbi:hypothetical protein GJAV_G00105120 [Gymnothorax javanicus]|nr:hypothetical protein GJAV_G00105120 [Gymnothorax javanicus]